MLRIFNLYFYYTFKSVNSQEKTRYFRYEIICINLHEKMTMVLNMYKERLKELREEHNLKQKSIADLLRIKENTYSEYETEYKIIPFRHLNVLCNYFNVSLDYILKFSDIKNYKNSKNNIDYKLQHLRLKELRKDFNLTQKQLAKKINVAPSTISDYESRNKPIATPFLYQICKKYNISADYLLGKIEEPKYLK